MNLTPDRPSFDLSGNRFVVGARDVSVADNVALPRFGNSVAEDALAHAVMIGSGAGLRRLLDQFSEFRFDLAAVTTDDNRFAVFQRSAAEGDELGDLDVTQTARDLSRVFGSPVETAHPEGPGSMTWWPHDIFVVQQRTPSTWRIHEPTELSALPGYTPSTSSDVEVWQGELTAEHGLYIPRGWAFELSSTDQPLDCTIFVVKRWTGIDILAQLPFAAGHWPLLRADAPVDIAAQTESYDGHLYLENMFGDTLSELASIEQVDSSLARLQVSVLEDNPLPRGAEGLTSNEPLRLLGPTGTKWLGEAGTHFSVAVSGRALDITIEALPAFAEVAAGEPFRIADLPLTGSAEGAKQMVAELCELELISPA